MSNGSLAGNISAQSFGRDITVDGVRTLVLDWGKGEPILCIHEVPISFYLNRKGLKVLLGKGFRAGLVGQVRRFRLFLPQFCAALCQGCRKSRGW